MSLDEQGDAAADRIQFEELDADSVILALGQSADLALLAGAARRARRGRRRRRSTSG